MNSVEGKTKLLSDPQTYCEMKNSSNFFTFPALREVMITLSSLPFELNSKANLFCTVSPNTHVIHAPHCFSLKQSHQLYFTLLANFATPITVSLPNTTLKMAAGSLVMMRSDLEVGVEGEGLWVVRNFIGRVAVGP